MQSLPKRFCYFGIVPHHATIEVRLGKSRRLHTEGTSI